MPTQTALSTLTADSDKGRKATDLFRHAYNAAELDDERGQILNENKAFPAALRELIGRYSMPVQAPQGGRIHIIRVPVNPGREWQEAVDAAGPDTGSDWDVRKVGGLYPPQPGEPRDEEHILVNFGKTIPNLKYATDWGKPFGLTSKAPRSVFAIGEHRPQLHRELKVGGMAIIAPVPCSFGDRQLVCFVWLGDVERGCGLGWVADEFGVERGCNLRWAGVGFDDDCWFAFGRE